MLLPSMFTCMLSGSNESMHPYLFFSQTYIIIGSGQLATEEV